MDLILEGIKKAFFLIFTLDREVLGITLLSLKVSGLATLISLFIGISVGTAVALTRFPGRQIVVSLINTGMGLPPVVVGLFVTIFLWRNGPLRISGDPLHTDGDHPGPGRHRDPDRHGDHPGGDPAPAGQSPPPDPRPRRHPPPDGVDTREGGAAPPPGCRDGGIRRRHLGGGRLDHGRRKHQRAIPGS